MIELEQHIVKKLNDCCEHQSNSSIIFGFDYRGLNVRCIYFQVTQTILIGFAERSVAWQVNISDHKLSELIPNEAYNVIKDLLNSNEKFSNRPLFELLLTSIEDLEINDVENAQNDDIIDLLRNTKTRDKKYDRDGNNPYFNHWRRVPPTRESLYKIQRYFGKEVRESCWENKVTAVFTDEPSKSSLNFLNPRIEIQTIKDLSDKED